MDFVVTGDGSKTLFHPEVGEHYHSKHGALQESKHVFLRAGLQHFLEKQPVEQAAVLEIGFGTGLNFLVTADAMADRRISLDYCGIEAYPLSPEVVFATGYHDFVKSAVWTSFEKTYSAALRQRTDFLPHMTLEIMAKKVLDFQCNDLFDVIYFDAFAAVHQPEMWNEETLTHVINYLKPGGVFVTYAITGNLKRSLKALGCTIEKVPGAPGKREMLRATKV